MLAGRWSIGFGLLLVVPALDAQSGLRGRVLMEPSEIPIAGVEVLIEALERSTHTDTTGAFLLEDFRPGQHEILVRRIGFRPHTRKLKFLAGQTLQVDFILTPTAAVIESLVVVGKPPLPASSRLADFERRRQSQVGRFITWADLRLNEFKHTNEMLRAARVQTQRDSRGRYVLVSSRGGPSCVGQIWLDGVRLSQIAAPVNVDDIPVATLAGVEYYRGAAETPPEFNVGRASCGTLVLWTRDR